MLDVVIDFAVAIVVFVVTRLDTGGDFIFTGVPLAGGETSLASFLACPNVRTTLLNGAR